MSLGKSSEIVQEVESGHPDSWVNAAVGMDDEAAEQVQDTEDYEREFSEIRPEQRVSMTIDSGLRSLLGKNDN